MRSRARVEGTSTCACRARSAERSRREPRRGRRRPHRRRASSLRIAATTSDRLVTRACAPRAPRCVRSGRRRPGALGTLGNRDDLAPLAALLHGSADEAIGDAAGAIGRIASRLDGAAALSANVLCPPLADPRAYVRAAALAGLSLLRSALRRAGGCRSSGVCSPSDPSARRGSRRGRTDDRARDCSEGERRRARTRTLRLRRPIRQRRLPLRGPSPPTLGAHTRGARLRRFRSRDRAATGRSLRASARGRHAARGDGGSARRGLRPCRARG